MNDRLTRLFRAAIVLVVAVIAAIVGWVVFYDIPATLTDLLGILLVIGTVLIALQVGRKLATSAFPSYDVAEVAVEGPISREGGKAPIPGRGSGLPADDIVEQIDAAADDENAEALLLKLNTPGGEVLPSDDIRRAAADFDGPTIAYATDVCASGGYWIASGCDELWSHDASIVGSIGVIGSSVNASELADKLGVSYERFAAGKYKDAGNALKEPTDDEREYLQGLIDDYYDDFIERVAEGRDMDPEAVRDTEARVYLGDEAHELGLVDSLGTRDDVEDRLAELLDRDEVSIEGFTPELGLAERLRGGVETAAYAFGAGLASSVDVDDGFSFRF
ncbi:signal peptide peptidase SppA [Haloferax mediterranei ATCC 33500]|uniref:Signal peptide peptidase SppA n=1 Tax=Haloferax mediterranei (strain ATCC 33500 / DSM 1411 / JCM 8866 / NBRC 14739 / NCIMB 2177 / R-4) TaxID=523841 RepID=I3R2W6_HALMT|nr:signal peptide peptidase SppA [Haloferax mediterranei]AFK18576.1 putative signal peptide peptidase SppA [Haloferax mediterranei ATCC 33500]AHZ22048.1 signal peptide peptidase SppA [Haloferax mediterranei ATCC 33500]EMA02148.1 putative signal peptide peptidase SppA [Haloferax mediterranei ATCC 33500]MDX5988665.1 signal peptide peptidase SppA [Haloferax mediterranei ATCC 33500]QCQ75077.1 signal peptide peptidase SppA [Haloferax mediterranei ATCC 33500]